MKAQIDMKAQIEFNWIFVIVIGALILFFFIGFTVKYKDLQEKKQEIILLNNFDNSLKLLERSSFTTSTDLDLFKNIEVRCNNNKLHINSEETNNLLFSDKNLGNRVLIWYQPFKLPFFITNFYYLMDNKKYYLIVNNNQELNNFVDNLIEELPDSFRNNVIKTNQYDSEDRRNRYISFIGDGDVQIMPSGNYNYGTVRINNQEYDYYGRELLYGAIFSEDYGCMINIVDNKIGDAVLMYENKINLIRRNMCNYNGILNELENLKQNKDENTVNNINNLNKNLANINCPVLY